MAITLSIDDNPVTVPPGTLVVDAAKKVGITIPVFCYHPKLKPAGMCRMCLVEIGAPAVDRATNKPMLDENGQQKIAWNPKLQPACTTPVTEGMRVRTASHSEAVRNAQREVLEFLLTSHPLDCPICDKGGECPLQNLTLAYGPGQTRFEFLDKQLNDKRMPLGDLILLDRERCIQCARCIRFQDEIAGDHVLGFYERGRKLEIMTFSEPPFNSYFSGNTTDICPVGALTTVDFHFRARPWELTDIPSLCNHCAVGCNITLGTRRSAKAGGWDILRVMPRQNEYVNEIWLCDKGRFAHRHARSPERLTQPMINWGDQPKPVSWDEAMAVVCERLKGAGGKAVGLIGDRLPNEDIYIFTKFLREVLHAEWAQVYPRVSGARAARQYGVASGTNLSALDPATSIVLVIGANLKEQAPIWYLRLRNRAKVFQFSNLQPPISNLQSPISNLQPPISNLQPPISNLQCREGTESLVALGLLNVALGKKSLPGVNEFRASVAQYTPAHVSELTGVPGEVIVDLAQALLGAENVIFAFGAEGAPEALAQHLANLAVITGHVGRPNNGLLPVWPHANTQGALDVIADCGLRIADLPPISNLQSPILYILGADPVSNGEALPEGAFVICHELFLTETARRANVIFPAQSWAERDGTFTNAERRVQRFYKALPPLDGTLADWEILRNIAHKLGLDWNYQSSEEIMRELIANAPRYAGLTYARLAQTEPQWPPVGNSDLYFGGTACQNHGGLGAQLPAECEAMEQYEVRWVEPEVAPIRSRRLYQRGTLIAASPVLKRRLTNNK